MPIRATYTLLAALATSSILFAGEPAIVREARPLDPDSPDVVGQFHQVGYPKYTDVEKRIIDRAQKLQDEQTAAFDKIKIGKTVFDYPGLIARGSIHFDSGAKAPYVLTFGIRPHLSIFAGSFSEYQVVFDAKGAIVGKHKVGSERTQGEPAAGPPAPRPEEKPEGGEKPQPDAAGRSR